MTTPPDHQFSGIQAVHRLLQLAMDTYEVLMLWAAVTRRRNDGAADLLEFHGLPDY